MQNMNELEQKIIEIFKDDTVKMYPTIIGFLDLQLIKTFISKCSLTDFEKLKDMEYDLTTQENKEV